MMYMYRGGEDIERINKTEKGEKNKRKDEVL